MDRGHGNSNTTGKMGGGGAHYPNMNLTGLGGHFASTPGRLPTPLTSPKSPFPQWATNIFRSSTGGLHDEGVAAVERDRELGDGGGTRDSLGVQGSGRFGGSSPRGDGGRSNSARWAEEGQGHSAGRGGYRRASSTSSWW